MVIDKHGTPSILLLPLESSAAYALATSLFLTLTLVTLFQIDAENVNDIKSAHPARRLRRGNTSENQKKNLV
jgi:hypothetical protein